MFIDGESWKAHVTCELENSPVGSDPSTYEMMQKVKTLQKRLISKTEEAVEKDLALQEKEKLYVQLKNIIARRA